MKLLAKIRALGFQPEVITYNAAIRVGEKSKDQWQMVVKLLAGMRTQEVQPDAISYYAAISACEKSKNQWQMDLRLPAESKLLAEMQDLGEVQGLVAGDVEIAG